MREILFRGKRLDNGAWETGSLVIVRMGCHDAQYFIADKMTGYHTPVDPSTVGQYTGLKDKNGKRIFEGDIVQYHERQFDGKDAPVCGVVIYTEGGFAVGAYFLNNWLWDSVHGNVQLRDVEVIGNIHDNPELLKGGEG